MYITENLFGKYYTDKLLLISHGGVGSEYLTKLLNIYHTTDKHPETNRDIKGAVVHFPYPPNKFKLDKIIYLYGDIYNSILSQIPRHYDNASKLCNDINYKHFHNLDELLNYKNEDPFNLEKQINNFFTNDINYPVILLKHNFNKSLIPILEEITNNSNFRNYEFKSRQSKFANLNKEKLSKLINIYGKLNNIVNNSPSLIIRFPKNNYHLSQKDVLKYCVKNNLPGKRVKHYTKINGYEIYNERQCNYKPKTTNYGTIRLKKPNEKEFNNYDFTEFGININSCNGGVEDPRYFVYKNDTYIIMNGLDKNNKRNMYLFNIEKNNFCKLYISNYNISGISKQKNWIPYINNDKVYIIYSISPLCILEVINIKIGECLCIKGNPFHYDNNYKYFGSTPLIQWNYPNFIGFLHTRLPHYSVPIIFDVIKLEVKYIGKQIIFKNPPGVHPWRGKIVQFPYNLEIINKDIIFSVEFEDKCPTLIYLNYINFCKAFSK
jgi:hypothetical protein